MSQSVRERIEAFDSVAAVERVVDRSVEAESLDDLDLDLDER